MPATMAFKSVCVNAPLPAAGTAAVVYVDTTFEGIVQQIGGEQKVLVRQPEREGESAQYKTMELKVKNAEALQGQASASDEKTGR